MNEVAKEMFFQVLSTMLPKETVSFLKTAGRAEYSKFYEIALEKCLVSLNQLSSYDAETRIDNSAVAVMLGSVLDNLGIGLEKDK